MYYKPPPLPTCLFSLLRDPRGQGSTSRQAGEHPERQGKNGSNTSDRDGSTRNVKASGGAPRTSRQERGQHVRQGWEHPERQDKNAKTERKTKRSLVFFPFFFSSFMVLMVWEGKRGRTARQEREHSRPQGRNGSIRDLKAGTGAFETSRQEREHSRPQGRGTRQVSREFPERQGSKKEEQHGNRQTATSFVS